jgi:small subunit ribosomal protein S21
MITYVKENENIERALQRFKKQIESSGLLKDLKARESYEKPTTAKKRKHAAAISRHKREMKKQTLPEKLY